MRAWLSPTVHRTIVLHPVAWSRQGHCSSMLLRPLLARHGVYLSCSARMPHMPCAKLLDSLGSVWVLLAKLHSQGLDCWLDWSRTPVTCMQGISVLASPHTAACTHHERDLGTSRVCRWSPFTTKPRYSDHHSTPSLPSCSCGKSTRAPGHEASHMPVSQSAWDLERMPAQALPWICVLSAKCHWVCMNITPLGPSEHNLSSNHTVSGSKTGKGSTSADTSW